MLALCIGRQLNLYILNFSNISGCTRSINFVNPLKGHHPISGKLRHWSLQIYIWEAHKYLCSLPAPPEAQLNPSWTQFWPLAVVARWCNWGSNHYSGLTLLPDTGVQELALNLWDHNSPNPNRRIGLVWISCFLFQGPAGVGFWSSRSEKWK